MSNKLGRAFFIASMSSEQIQRLHSKERSTDPRYLTPSEISELFSLKIGPKSEAEWKYVEEMESDHNKQIWKKRQLAKIGDVSEMSSMEELHDFDNFVIRNWNYAAEPTLQDY